jgi:predicted MFS family arabinose efflux permease
MAITIGAAAGGLLFDNSGYASTFVVSAAMLAGSAVVALAASRARKPADCR